MGSLGTAGKRMSSTSLHRVVLVFIDRVEKAVRLCHHLLAGEMKELNCL